VFGCSLEPVQKCQNSVVVRYWYDAYRRWTSRQAIENQDNGSGCWTYVSPSGRGGPARWKQSGKDFGGRMAPSSVS